MEEKIEEEKEPWHKGPIRFIMALFLALLIVLMVVPYYSVKIDPEPHTRIMLEQPLFNYSLENASHKISNRQDFLLYLNPNEPAIKQTATIIATRACDGNIVCHAKAVFYFVQDNFDYVSDPSDEYIETAKEVLATGGSDCDGAAILLANLEQAIGVRTRFVFIPGHVFIQAWIPEAHKKYKEQDDWINLDPTCRYCGFGEIPIKNKDKPRTYVG
ncbi:transglutaminase-like domain-containing protein [Candidatus Woesearchaeota archaeon]|nr:transglutaminase-like domain-containing protein [Candidatus Woesearchaeota archaeon]